MRHRLYVHLVWTTRDREWALTSGATGFLRRFISAVASQERCAVLASGMVSDHVHVLLRLHPTTSLPRLVQRLKGGSAVLAMREGATARPLRWAKGYNIESVSPAQVERAREYVANQALHHPDRAILGGSSRVAADLRGTAAQAAARPTDCRSSDGRFTRLQP